MATYTEIANYALSKIGGAGDQITGAAFISDIDADDPVSKKCLFLMPRCREKVITDLASADCPFRETIRYADLGAEIASAALPEIGEWEYAYNLPGDCLAVVRQISEAELCDKITRKYKFETILNKGGNGRVFLTNYLTNSDNTSAFIEYVIDQVNPAVFSRAFVECLATLLAAELCPLVGKDIKTRQQMLLEYGTISVPAAKSFNQSQFDNYSEKVESYLGGR